MRALAVLLLACACAACTHDLDKLKADRDELRPTAGTGGKSGNSGAGGSKPGVSGRDGGLGGSGGSSGSMATDAGLPCGPCEPLSDKAKMLGLRACCRGAVGDECGITFGEGLLCLPREVPAQDNASCGELRVLGMRLPGCCRPDGRCGVVAEGLGLGCVAREELMLMGGMAADPIACEYSCEQDDDCRGALKGLQCAETRDHSKLTCVETCLRDPDCRRGSVCVLSNDLDLNRVVAACREPLGDLDQGDFCSRAEECVHGICGIVGSKTFCTQLCRNKSDCPAGYLHCTSSDIPRPDGGMEQNFSICLP